MGVTTPNALPFPEYLDPVDVPVYLKLLAEAVESKFSTSTELAAVYRTIADSYTKAQVDAAITARVVPVITGGTYLHFGTAFVTPAAGGKATITHGAGFTPDNVIAVATDPDADIASRKGVVCNPLHDTYTGTTFAIRVYRNDDASSVETGIRINYICRKN